jgi:hypothetical protein
MDDEFSGPPIPLGYPTARPVPLASIVFGWNRAGDACSLNQ